MKQEKVTTEIVSIDPEEYGLTEETAKGIRDMFVPMLETMANLEERYNEIISVKDITPEVVDNAKKLRLEYVKVRTSTAKIHKELKAFYLNGGRFVDGWKNAQKMAGENHETKLKEIENHFENIRKAEIAKLDAERTAEIQKYAEVVPALPGNLGEMDEVVYKHFLKGIQDAYEEKQEEKRLEAERKEAERKKVEQERKKRESERKKEERELAKQRKEQEKEAARLLKIKQEQEAEAKRLLEEQEAIDRAKKEEEERIKRLMEEEEAKKLAAIEAEKAKGDEDRYNDLIKDLDEITMKYYGFESVKYKKIHGFAVEAIKNLLNEI